VRPTGLRIEGAKCVREAQNGESGREPLGSGTRKFLNHLGHCQLPKKYSVPRLSSILSLRVSKCFFAKRQTFFSCVRLFSNGTLQAAKGRSQCGSGRYGGVKLTTEENHGKSVMLGCDVSSIRTHSVPRVNKGPEIQSSGLQREVPCRVRGPPK
jgi:hypothetical protein